MHKTRDVGALTLVLALATAGCTGGGGGASDLDGGTDGDGDTDTDGDGDSDSDGDTDCDVEEQPGPDLVVTSHGAIHGFADGATTVFLGIPYAAPPTGELRWRPPEPPGCYEDVVEALEYGPVCPQLDRDTEEYEGDEDCLTLNVWTTEPLPASGEGRPVLFFVHGGGNCIGSASESYEGVFIYDGRALAETNDAVVVTVQYRLGPLGYLAHDGLAAESPQGVSGNYGILDLVSALGWVRDEIAAFGGDPDRVLVFGESAGAVDTCMLLASPLAQGLFSAALMESGGCPGRTADDALEESAALVDAAGCAGDDDEVTCLRGLTPQELLEALPPEVSVAGASPPYQPHVDGWVLPDAPLELIEQGDHNDVPLVVGANSDETSQDVPQSLTEAQYEALVQATFGPLADDVLAQYAVIDYGTAYSAFYHLTSDLKFVCTARQVARAALAGGSSPVFHYHFTEAFDLPVLEDYGAFHGIELTYVFDYLDEMYFLLDPPAEESQLVDAIQLYWGSLAADGDVAVDGLPEWPPYDADGDQSLILEGGAIHAAAGVRAEQCDFWESLFDWL